MQVTPVSKTLAEVLRGNFLRIPRFQRPYSWDQDNLSDFWTDLVERQEDEYFMGSMVIYRDGKERNVIFLVDGQQRITTITLTLAVVRDYLDEMGEDDLASGVHGLLEATDLDNKSRFILEHDPANTYFQNRIQQRKPSSKAAASDAEQRALRDARNYIDKSLSSYLAFAEDRQKTTKPTEVRRTALLSLRNRILALQFISIELGNDDDAYLIFETLNTRGKDLQISDLVKNLFTRLIKPTTKGLDAAKSGWGEVLERFSALGAAIDPDTFLQHYWLATYEYVSKARLFGEMKTRIKVSNAEKELEDLKEAAAIYATILAPGDTKWAKEEREVQASLAALNTFRVAQATPLVLSIMRLYREKTISLSSLRKVLALIEKFTFQFNAVTQSRGGGGIANMYSRLARDVYECETPQRFAKVFTEIKAKLDERVPSIEEFKVGFNGIRFTSEFTRDRALVRYVLRKLSESAGLPNEIDATLYTIEHIRPESAISDDDDYELVASLGNLLFVPEKTNLKLKAKPFSTKKQILIEDKVPLDKYLQAQNSWGHTQITRRLEALAKTAHQEIWSL